MNLVFDKYNYNIEKFNSQLEAYCAEKEIDGPALLKMQLISEEFLSGILFPNYDGQIRILIFLKGNNKVLTFEYSDEKNYMNDVNEKTVISLKLLEKQTEDIISTTINGTTSISFII